MQKKQKFKEKNHYYILENAMIRKIKIHNILDIIENFKSRDLINVLTKKNYENIYLNVSYDFSKPNGSKENKV
jgi:hypothetical protein